MPRANTLTGGRVSRTFKSPGGAPAGGTAERILDGTLELLNREGGAAATTNHIAAHLGMSPGNLYYHFRNREEIVRALFARLRAEGLAATALAENETLAARDFGERHVQGLRSLWRYRFFFRDVTQLVARDPLLAADFRRYHETLAAQYRAVFERLVAEGNMRPPRSRNDLDRLVTNAILLWFNWLAYLGVLRPRAQVTRRDVVEGALSTFLLVEPLLEEEFAAEARAVIEGFRG